MTVFHTQGCCGSYAPLESAFNSEKDSTFMEGIMNLFLSAVSSDKWPPKKTRKTEKKQREEKLSELFLLACHGLGGENIIFQLD